MRIGQKVRCLRNVEGQFTKHKEYVVRSFDETSNGVVVWISVVKDDGGGLNGWAGEYFDHDMGGPW